MHMKVQFLGITGSIQTAHSGNMSLLVSHGDTKVLVDVSGSPMQSLALCNVDPLQLTHLFLTHAHVDHLYGLPSLLHQLWLLGRRVEFSLIGNKETISKAKQLCAIFSLDEKKNMFPLNWIVLDEVMQTLHCGDLVLHPFPVSHGIPTFGCLFISDEGSVAYLADSTPLKNYPLNLQKPTLLIHEVGGLDSEREALNDKGHSSALQAALVAKELHAGRLLLCHLPAQETLYQELLDEARSVFPSAGIPEVFYPYEIQIGEIEL